MNDLLPLISVVIPTRLRPELLLSRALPSARAQWYPNIEIVVVIDGPDPVTVSALSPVLAEDPRVRILALTENVGGSDARNAGVQAARGEWIAFLDDDDEWLPHNLEQQLQAVNAAQASGETLWPVSVCGSLMRTPDSDTPNPPRLPDPGEPMGDYMLARRSFHERECGFMTSAIFAPRALLLAHPFRSGLPRQQDCDWVLRVSALDTVKFYFTFDIATIWYFGGARKQISGSLDWRQSLGWILECYDAGLVSSKAMAGFINGSVARFAKGYSQYQALLPLTRAMLLARPRLFEWARFIRIWAVPLSWRTLLRYPDPATRGPSLSVLPLPVNRPPVPVPHRPPVSTEHTG